MKYVIVVPFVANSLKYVSLRVLLGFVFTRSVLWCRYVACDVIGLCVSTLLDLLSVSLLHYIRFSSLSGLLPSSYPLSHCTDNYKLPLFIRAWFNNS
jgi:hypothetical protein